MKRAMRVKPNTALYESLIACASGSNEWRLEGKLWRIVGASKIDCSDYIRIELEEI